jgi:hypothetical protein
MSTLKVNTIKDNGTAIDLENGIKIGGASPLQNYTASGTEPSSGNANGDYWYDSANSKFYQYWDSDFREITIVAPSYYYGGRGVFGGGTDTNLTLDYITISTAGNATDFGDAWYLRESGGAASDGSRGFWYGGLNSSNTVSNNGYSITFATLGNATNTIGDINNPRARGSMCCNKDYIIHTGGQSSYNSNTTNTILRFTVVSGYMAASSFGNMGATKMGHSMWNDSSRYLTFSGTNSVADIAAGSFTSSGASWIAQLTGNGSQPTGAAGDETRAITFSGTSGTQLDTVVIQNNSNATSFGQLNTNFSKPGACTNATRIVFGGSSYGGTYNHMSYVTIATTGNGSDFGDLTVARYRATGCSGT